MTYSLSSIIFIGLAFQATSALAECYYPNGNVTTADFQCQNSDLCCPLNWQCLSNGLCYDPAQNIYERHTCADRSWASKGCPNFCTYSLAGNEGMGVCDNGKFCCDGDHTRGCCDGNLVNGTEYLDLGAGTVVATVLPMLGSASAASTVASTSAAASSAATTQASTSTAAPPANSCPCAAV